MPDSHRENDKDVIEFVSDSEREVYRILDVGAGWGTYGKMLLRAGIDVHIDAVEIWGPYIDQYNLDFVYDDVFQVDVRLLTTEFFANYDLVIFGDVLEHMTHEESMEVWRRAHTARYGMISVPIIHFPQGEIMNNPHEVHQQEHLHPAQIRKDYGPFVLEREYRVTGTFIKEMSAGSQE